MNLQKIRKEHPEIREYTTNEAEYLREVRHAERIEESALKEERIWQREAQTEVVGILEQLKEHVRPIDLTGQIKTGIDEAIAGANRNLLESMKADEVLEAIIVQPDWEADLPDEPLDMDEAFSHIINELRAVGFKAGRDHDPQAEIIANEMSLMIGEVSP